MRLHPQYLELHNELHARPFPVMRSPGYVFHYAALREEGGAEAEERHIARLLEEPGVLVQSRSASHLHGRIAQGEVRIGRHSEFTSYVFILPGRLEACFPDPAALGLPAAWIDGIPGEIISKVLLTLIKTEEQPYSRAELETRFGSEVITGNYVTFKCAVVWTDFNLVGDDFSRYLVQDFNLTPRRTGRMVQRLIEIDTYRMMALLSLPLARQSIPEIDEQDRRLTAFIERLNEERDLAEEKALLRDLISLATGNEHMLARINHRFNATGAYRLILEDRLQELRQEQVPGYQTLSEFLARRVTPALRTCESVHGRIVDLSDRIQRATDLLRTRVNVNLEAQNQDILSSLAQRAQVQLRLQQAVEGLSVMAISYYGLGLLKVVLTALKQTGLHVDSDIVTGLAAPLVVLLVWGSLRAMKRRIMDHSRSDG